MPGMGSPQSPPPWSQGAEPKGSSQLLTLDDGLPVGYLKYVLWSAVTQVYAAFCLPDPAGAGTMTGKCQATLKTEPRRH